MQSLSTDARFLGVDLKLLWQDMRRPWTRMHEWPLLRWLTPSASTRLLRPDGQESYWLGAAEQASPFKGAPARFLALELPDALLLRRNLVVPSLGHADLAQAVELEVRSVSPFAVGDLVWGFASSPAGSSKLAVEAVLASRRQIEPFLASQATRLEGGLAPEVWARTAHGPVVLGGFGEGWRAAYVKRYRRMGVALIFLAVGLLGAIALTPLAQLRARALDAAGQHQALVARAVPLVEKRAELVQATEQVVTITRLLADRVDPLRVVEMLTNAFPDDTSLQSLKLQGLKVSVSGFTGNASALIQLLGEQPGLREVRAPAPATRVQGSTKETFVIEFSLDPAYFGARAAARDGMSAVAAKPASAVSAVVPAVPATSAAALSGAGSSAASAPAPISAVVPLAGASAPAGKPAIASAPSGGSGSGGATFGGGARTPAPQSAPASAPVAGAKP